MRLDSLTGLRFIAAAYVLLLHSTLRSVPDSWLQRATVDGYTGVGFFFVLSGFVLAWSHHPGTSVGTFYRNRFARVWPLHAVTMLAGLALLGTESPSHLDSVVRTLASLFLLQSWLGAGWTDNGNAASWSLSCEAFFYALLPLLILIRPGRSPWLRIAAVLVPVTAGTVYLATSAFPMDVLVLAPWFRLVEFLVGVQLGRAFRAGWRPRLDLGHATIILLGVLIPVTFVDGWVTHDAQITRVFVQLALVAPFGLLIAAAAAADARGSTGWLSGRAMVRLGEWSFALYMVHGLLVRASPLHGGPGWLVATCFLSVAVACAAHAAIERPLERLIRGRRSDAVVGRQVVIDRGQVAGAEDGVRL